MNKRLLSSYVLAALVAFVSAAATQSITSPQSPLQLVEPDVSTTECVDALPEECSRKSHLCHIGSYDRLMRKNCARTCGYCHHDPVDPPAGECVDKAPDCAVKKQLCSKPEYKRLVAKYCALTCGLCTPTKDECLDKDPDACFEHRKLCTDPFIQPYMRQKCPGLCGFC
ncbi:hypothetical protein BKA70DRAFT_1246524 [Coprinopsis sp. MPI-PUGE-AT-0042]|nr:hypothetical protein BKA70DRAFT_1246524 [Coprinopsis sp. MPI-PUGE-AT-0042]